MQRDSVVVDLVWPTAEDERAFRPDPGWGGVMMSGCG